MMKSRWFSFIVILILRSQPGWSQASEPPYTDVEAGASYENLNHGLAPWLRSYLLVVHRSSQRKAIYGTLEENRRFSEVDPQVTVGGYYPLRNQWTLLAEGSGSPTHHVLPKWATLAQLERAFGNGWEAHAGISHREYNMSTVDIGNFAIEKYVDAFRFAYTFYPSYVRNVGAGTAHRIEASYYYGGSALTLNVARGRELENVAPAAILQSSVRTINLSGTHWLSPGWAVSYTANWTAQGRFYTHRGASLGLRRRL